MEECTQRSSASVFGKQGVMTEFCARAMWQAPEEAYTALPMVPVTAAVHPNLERGSGVRRAESFAAGHRVRPVNLHQPEWPEMGSHTSGALRISHACQRRTHPPPPGPGRAESQPVSYNTPTGPHTLDTHIWIFTTDSRALTRRKRYGSKAARSKLTTFNIIFCSKIRHYNFFVRHFLIVINAFRHRRWWGVASASLI